MTIAFIIYRINKTIFLSYSIYYKKSNVFIQWTHSKNSIINIRIKEKLFILREYLALKDF